MWSDLLKEISHRFGDRNGRIIHFSASWGDAFSSSAISRELSTVFSDHVAVNSSPVPFNEAFNKANLQKEKVYSTNKDVF